jgi:hypothetical protein
MNKTFDAVSWMRKRREEIDLEDAGLSWEERTRKTLEAIKDDPIWKRLKERSGKTISDPDKPGYTKG